MDDLTLDRNGSWFAPSPETIERLYVGAWTNALQYGTEDAQEVSLYALRSHGYEVWGNGYWEEFVWQFRPPGKEIWCIIDPDVKPHR